MAALAPLIRFNNKLTMPLLGLGTWKSKPGEVKSAVETAIKIGYRHLDCAAIYENEAEVGAALKACEVPRGDLFVTSKLWNTEHHPDAVEPACRQTLKDLGLQYLDLYLIHWPTGYAMSKDGTMGPDPTPLIDTWLAMEQLVDRGLVKSIGVSNFNSQQMDNILEHGKLKPVTNQVECHPYFAQQPLLEYCRERDIVLTAYSPLGSADRPTTLMASNDGPALLEDPMLKEIAARHSKSPAQIALRWQTQRAEDGVVVIPKSVSPARIRQNFELFDFVLSDEEMAAIARLDRNIRLIDPQFLMEHPSYPFSIPF